MSHDTQVWGIVGGIDIFTQIQSLLTGESVRLVHYPVLPQKADSLDCMLVVAHLWQPTFSEHPTVLLLNQIEDLETTQEAPLDYMLLDHANRVALRLAVQSARERHFLLQQSLQLQLTLRNVEERFHSTVQVSSDAIILVNAQGIVQFTNQAALKLFGVQDLSGKPFGLPLTNELKMVELDVMGNDTTHIVEMRVDATTWYGEPAYVIFLRDVTEREQMQTALEKSEKRFRMALESAPFPVMLHADDGEILFINQIWTDITGYTHEQIPTIPDWAELAHGQRNHPFRERINALFETNRIVKEGTFPVQIADKTTRYWDFHTAPLSQLDDGRRMVLSMAVDVTERLAMEEKMRLLQRAVEASPIGITISDVNQDDSPLIYVNPAFETITGYRADEVIGKNCRFLQQDDRHQSGIAKIRQSLRDETECKVVLRNYRKDGTMFWNELNMAPVFDGQHNVTHFVGIQQDITTAKENEYRIIQSNQQFVQLQKIGEELRHSREIETVYGLLYREVGEKILHVPNMLVFSFNDVTGLFTYDFVLSDWQINEKIQRSTFPIEKLGLTADQIVAIGDNIKCWCDVTPHDWYIVDQQVGTVFYVPLLNHDEIHTGAAFWCRDPHVFDDVDQALVMMIGRQVGAALANARLYRQLMNQTDELRSLYNAISVLFQSRNIFGLGQQLVHTIVNEFHQSDCAFLVVDTPKGLISRVAVSGRQRDMAKYDLHVHDEVGLIPEAIRRAALLYVPDTHEHPLYLAGIDNTRSELVIPLLTSAGNVVGVLDFQSPHIDAFTEQDIRILRAFAERAANAVETVQLYEELDSYVSQLEWNVARRTSELKQAKDQIEFILNGIRDMILLVDERGYLQRTNPVYHEWFTDTLLQGKQLYDLVAPMSRRVLQDAFERIIETGAPAHCDVKIHKRDGVLIDAEVLLAVIQNTTTKVKQVVCSVHDITTHKRLEQSLRDALEHERELSELKTRFASMVSHEFRTPLSVILSSSSMLHDYYDRYEVEQAQQKLQGIIDQVRRLTRVMDDVLMLSRGDLVGIQCEPEPVHVNELCYTIIDEVKQGLYADHTIQFDMMGVSGAVMLDTDLIRHILHNLLSNAIKYSPKEKAVMLLVKCEQNNLEFRVIDQGIGIPKKDQERLFTTFFRAKNVGAVEGTGLGLVIAARAAKAHGGSIRFESEEGHGTTFIVSIPIQS